MEDRKTAIAIFICIIFVMIYSELFLAPVTRPTQPVQPVESSQEAPNQSTTAAQTATQPSSTAATPPSSQGPASAGPSPADLAASQVTRVRNNLMELRIVHLGGRVNSLTLRDHLAQLAEPGTMPEHFEMISSLEGKPLPLGVYTAGIDDSSVVYELAGSTTGVKREDELFIVKEDQQLSLRFEGQLPSGGRIEKKLTFQGNSYLFDVSVNLDTPPSDGSNLWLEWSTFEPNPDEASYINAKGFVYLGEEPETVTPDKLVDGPLDLGANRWVGYGDKYFMSTIIPASKGPNTRALRDGSMLFSRAAGQAQSGSFQLYVGPKEYKRLQQLGHDLHRSIDLGVFAFLGLPMLELIRFFYDVFGNYGLAIVLLTLIIKAVFLPLTAKSFQSMSAMQQIQPEIQDLRKRFKDDPTKMNSELMALYKKHGVNPLGGCFPMLIQIPVFLGLYNALLYSIELRHAPFALWIVDLSAPERLPLLGINIPVMVILMGIAMFLQQWTTPSAMDPTQKKIMMLVPIMFTFFFINFPAGLVLYWLTNTVISIVQQFYIRGDHPQLATRATALASLLLFAFAWSLTLIKA